METSKILTADILDILFEGKNKEYGAYDLRKTYNKRIAVALTSMAFLCLLFFISRLLANDKGANNNRIAVTDVNLEEIKKPDIKKIEPVVIKQPKATPRVETIKFVTPIVVKDKDVTELPPPVDKLDDAQIGLIDHDGVKADQIVAAPIEEGTGVIEPPKRPEVDYERTFVKVEKEARFPGGPQAWKRYLERNLNVNAPTDDGAPVGNYTVKVQFIVDKEGVISNVQAVEVPKACPACGPEAVKVIKNGPKWEPAIQNDRKVTYQAAQYITFQVAEE